MLEVRVRLDDRRVVRRRDDPRRAFWVVDDFEAELARYTGAPFAVAFDSCTNALFACLVVERARCWIRRRPLRGLEGVLTLPRHTYVGVLQAARNAGWDVVFSDQPWEGSYVLAPTRVVDSARDLRRGMYQPGTLTCVSFHAAKQLPLGRGGAVLVGGAGDAGRLRRMRVDGRREGAGGGVSFPGFHSYMPPDTAARGLWLLSYLVDEPPALRPDLYPDLSRL